MVSFFMDVSSEMIHGLLPVFLVTVLGASALSVGLIEGIAEATASIAKVFSGALSDRLAKRKPLLLLGYGISALAKPLFPLAASTGWVLTARILDRVGKGVRVAPRDALVADVAREKRVDAARLKELLPDGSRDQLVALADVLPKNGDAPPPGAKPPDSGRTVGAPVGTVEDMLNGMLKEAGVQKPAL